jgi:hypothetical protein
VVALSVFGVCPAREVRSGSINLALAWRKKPVRVVMVVAKARI